MKPRTFYTAIALLAALLVAVGAVGFWTLTAQNPRSLITKGGQAVPAAAQFVPRQSPLMTSLLARPDRLWQLRQLLTPANRRFASRQEWQALKDSFADLLGWDYDVDVRPWLDEEITFAVTTDDFDRDNTNGLQAGYLALLSCRDVEAARASLHILWQKRAAQGRNLVFETVSGVPLIYDQVRDQVLASSRRVASEEYGSLPSLASAVVGDRFVLLANDVQVLRQAIATYQAPDVSLAKTVHYREAITRLSPERIGWLYVNIPSFVDWLGLATEAATSPIKSEGQSANFIFASLQAASTGLVGETAIAPAPGQVFRRTDVTEEKTAISANLSLLPPEAPFASVGTNLDQTLQSLNGAVGGYRFAQQAIATFWQSLSLDLDAPAVAKLPSLPGHYVLAWLPKPTPTWLLITENQSSQALVALDEWGMAQGLNVSQVPLGDRSITAWTRFALNRNRAALKLDTQVVGVHAAVPGHEVFATSLAGLEQVLNRSTSDPSAEPSDDSWLSTSLAPKQGAVTYVNWPVLAPILTQQFAWLRILDAAGRPLTSHIGPITINFREEDSSDHNFLKRGEVVIKLVETT